MKKNSFFSRVYALVAQIPPGQVMTYGQIATTLQTSYSAKLVGFAMSSAPEERGLPCHRVINRLGEMSPGLIFGGPDVQRTRLMAEGTPFLPNGRVDLSKARFIPTLEQLEELEEAFS